MGKARIAPARMMRAAGMWKMRESEAWSGSIFAAAEEHSAENGGLSCKNDSPTSAWGWVVLVSAHGMATLAWDLRPIVSS
mmetsp:Transcript_10244/g.31974  ORF Transcript_10244/g.31974 Transcript_10244/m.31974 type:complete len:80 (+) Transcript_10244:1937-2176(+)